MQNRELSTQPKGVAPMKYSISKPKKVTGYQIAKALLLENARLHADHTSDPFRHNLNAALFQLTEAIEADALKIKAQLSRIEELQIARRDRR
jgi:hypothetical protein